MILIDEFAKHFIVCLSLSFKENTLIIIGVHSLIDWLGNNLRKRLVQRLRWTFEHLGMVLVVVVHI